jgi:hypothetical protein
MEIQDINHTNEAKRSAEHQALGEQCLLAVSELLRSIPPNALAEHGPRKLYDGALTVVLRVVFLAYTEQRGFVLNSVHADGTIQEASITGLHSGTRPCKWLALMDYFQLLAMVSAPGPLPRHHDLFDPDEYPFLRGLDIANDVLDVVLDRALGPVERRINWGALEPEHIGAVYSGTMDYAAAVSSGPAIGVKPTRAVVDVDQLLAQKPAARSVWLAKESGNKISATLGKALEKAVTCDDVVAALGRRVSELTPRLVAPGTIYLQPGPERRSSGSHYTPQALTEPIVRTTFRPHLEDFGPSPTSAQILSITACDPCIGAGAFLAEALRQLAALLVTAWSEHSQPPDVDGDIVLHAKRFVLARCIFGVDKNPMAVKLTKATLWLETMEYAKPFPILEQTIKCGDALVGQTNAGIAEFRWMPDSGGRESVDGALFVDAFTVLDQTLNFWSSNAGAQAWFAAVKAETNAIRQIGDLVLASFFAEDKDAARETRRQHNSATLALALAGDSAAAVEVSRLTAQLHDGHRLTPFHWHFEFSMIFGVRPSVACTPSNAMAVEFDASDIAQFGAMLDPHLSRLVALGTSAPHPSETLPMSVVSRAVASLHACAYIRAWHAIAHLVRTCVDRAGVRAAVRADVERATHAAIAKSPPWRSWVHAHLSDTSDAAMGQQPATITSLRRS